MKDIPNRNRRGNLPDSAARPHQRGREAVAARRGKTPSAAQVIAPWQHYKSRLSAARARRLRDHAPNFLVIAPPRTATTWTYEILSTDRRVFIPEKECRYFSHFWREYPLSSYYAQFQNPFGAAWRGEASPSYFILPSSVIATIREELPDTKLIVLLRDPGERLWSHARHSFMYKEGWFRGSTAWRIEEVSEIDWCHALLHPVIRAFDDYAGALVRWAEHFPPEQMLVVASEMIGADPERAYNAIYDFLALEKPAPPSPFLRNRPNPSPRVEPPHVIAELLAALAASGRARLEAALPGLPSGLADQLRAAIAYWHRDQPAGLVGALPKEPGMGREPGWDQLTRATFPRELLTWSYTSAEGPPNSELLHLAALNFEYSYFSAPLEKGMPEETLFRRVQALGTTIMEHDGRLGGVEGAATALRERLSGLEHTVEQRTERLSSLEETVDTRSDRLLALEGRADEQEQRIGGLEAPNAIRDQRLAQLEQTLAERSARLSAVEGWSAAYSERLDAIETGNTQRDERLRALEQTTEERTGRLMAVESGIAELQRRAAASDSELRLLRERHASLAGVAQEAARDAVQLRIAVGGHSDRFAALATELDEAKAKLTAVSALEARIRQEADRTEGLERAIAKRDRESAGQNRNLAGLRLELAAAASDLASLRANQGRLQTVDGEIADLRAILQKALYAVALLQESLQGVEDELSQQRLSRIETGDLVGIDIRAG